MKMQVKTVVLQELLAKAMKGVGGNKMVDITMDIAIDLHEGKLTLRSTDGTNFLTVSVDGVQGDPFSIVIPADTFSKLVQKFSCEKVSLEVKDNYLEVSGNGIYKLKIPYDELGNPIKFPTYDFDEGAETVEVELNKVKRILNTNSKATAKTMDEPALTGYFFAENVITSDGYVVCCNAMPVIGDGKRKFLLPEQFLRLMLVSEAEKVRFSADEEGALLVRSNNFELFGYTLGGNTGVDLVGQYPYDAIMKYIQEDFGAECKVQKAALLEALSRLSLVVGDYDKNEVNLDFTKTGIVISNKTASGTETVLYSGVKEYKPFKCVIDIEELKTQVQVQNVEDVTLYYGHPSAIRMTDGKMSQVVSLVDDSEE